METGFVTRQGGPQTVPAGSRAFHVPLECACPSLLVPQLQLQGRAEGRGPLLHLEP